MKHEIRCDQAAAYCCGTMEQFRASERTFNTLNFKKKKIRRQARTYSHPPNLDITPLYLHPVVPQSILNTLCMQTNAKLVNAKAMSFPETVLALSTFYLPLGRIISRRFSIILDARRRRIVLCCGLRPSVCPSVCPSVSFACPIHN